jgi:hypothetical protein
MRGSQQTNAAAPVHILTGRAARPVQHLRSRPIRALAGEVRHFHQLERAGESAWTPWVAIAGLFLFLLSIELLVFGIVEGVSHLLASAP